MAVKRGDRLEIQQCRPDLRLHQRHLIQDGVYDAFTKRFAETAGAVKVADGFEPGAVIGPLIDMKAVEKVEAHIMASAAFFENAPYV
jgi:Aldehyde dehydrogenase family